MTYTKIFDAEALEKKRPRESGAVPYFYHGEIELAINVAFASRRPLLLTGLPGTGKSSVAEDIAWKMRLAYHTESITSRTQARDLLWSYDSVRRLSDAAAGKVKKDEDAYVRPGVLWKAFSPGTAPGGEDAAPAKWSAKGAVVLLDEIDKAEPDVPNDLLGVVDTSVFRVPDLSLEVRKPKSLQLLIVLTSNGERALPPAFLRRCISYEIPPLTGDLLDRVVERHFAAEKVRPEPGLIDAVEQLFLELRGRAASKKLRQPSTAELLDALFACTRLNIVAETQPEWRLIAGRALWKHGELDSAPRPSAS